MDKNKLNSFRRMAGIPQDFRAEPKKEVVSEEDSLAGISQILRGGDYKFFLVTDAKKNDELGDVLAEVDFPALVNILRGAKETKGWELFPHNEKNKALNLARKRLATLGETIGDGAWARNAHNTPHPTREEMAKLEQEEDFDLDPTGFEDEWEPSTNICPECEGGEHAPAHGVCERCGGLGEIYEAHKQCLCGHNVKECDCPPDCKCKCNVKEEQEEKADKDYDKDGKLETPEEEYKGSRDKAIKKNMKEFNWRKLAGLPPLMEKKDEKVESPPKRDVVDWSDVRKAGEEVAKEVHGKVDNKKLDGIIDNAKKHKPDSTASAIEHVKQMLRSKEEEEEAKPDYKDLDKDGDKKEPMKKAAKEAKKENNEKVKESMHYYDTKYDSFEDDESSAVNVAADYETTQDQVDDIADNQAPEDYEMANDTTAVKVPSKILSELKRVIDEVTAEAEKAKPRDFERAHYYEATAEALQIVHSLLAEKTVEGLKRAQIYVHKMANVSRALIPDVVWKFIIDGGTKRSLKNYLNDVKEPVTGKPFDSVDVDELNKNTHTQ